MHYLDNLTPAELIAERAALAANLGVGKYVRRIEYLNGWFRITSDNGHTRPQRRAEFKRDVLGLIERRDREKAAREKHDAEEAEAAHWAARDVCTGMRVVPQCYF